MFGLFKSLNNKTQIMMANAAMKAGHLALNKSPTPPDVLQTHTLLQLDLLCTQNGIPSIVELHEKQGRKEPSYYNGGCGGLAHSAKASAVIASPTPIPSSIFSIPFEAKGMLFPLRC